MIGQFKPVTGVMGSGIGQFTLPGNNAGFCAAILQKSGAQTPLRLESLTYVRPDRREALQQPPQQPLVVNLLMQLRTYYDQSNTYLRNQAALNIQLTNQLRQVLALSSGPVRSQAGAIQRAVQGNLYRNGEFQRALEGLAREVKKNGSSHQALTVRLPDSGSAAASGGRQSPASASGTVQQTMPAFRTPELSGPEGKPAAIAGSRWQAAAPMVHRSPSEKPVKAPAQTEPSPKRARGSASEKLVKAPVQTEPARKDGQPSGRKGKQFADATQAVEPALESPNGAREIAQGNQAIPPRAEATNQTSPSVPSAPISTAAKGKLLPRSGGDWLTQTVERISERTPERVSVEIQRPTLWRQTEGSGGRATVPRPFPTVVQGPMYTALLTTALRLPINAAFFYQLRYARPGQRSPVGAVVPLTDRLATFFEYSSFGQQTARRSYYPQTTGAHAPVITGGTGDAGILWPSPDKTNTLTNIYASSGATWGNAHLTTPAVALTALSRVPNFRRIGQTAPESTAEVRARLLGGQKRLTAQEHQAIKPAITSSSIFAEYSRHAAATPTAGWTGPVVNRRIAGDWLPVVVPPTGVAIPAVSHGATLAATYPWLTWRSSGQWQEIAPTGGPGGVARWTGLHRHFSEVPELPAAAVPVLGWTPRPLMNRTVPVPGTVPAGEAFNQIPVVSPVSREIFRMPFARQARRGVADGSRIPALTALMDSSSAGNTAGIFQPAVGGTFQPVKQLRTIPAATKMAGIGGHLIQMQQAVRGILNGGYKGSMTALHRARQVSVALSGLEAQADQVRQQALSPGLVPVLHRAASGENVGAAEPFAPLLRTGGQADAARLQDTSARSGQSGPSRAQDIPKMIYRRPEHPAPAQGESSADSGEAVLQAQTVSPARVAAMNAAYSYPPGGNTGRNPAPPVEELTREQEERITQRVLEDINYNRMASEVLDRVERRLRTERRKFGR